MVHKTENVFSDISADQAHEQNHQCIKSDGGAIVLTKYAAALWRWTVGGPEINWVLQEFEMSLQLVQNKQEDNSHEKQKRGTQTAFVNDVLSLGDVIEECVNPFLEESNELFVPTTKQIADTSVVESE